MPRPHLLFLAHRIPYPPNKGDKIRSWNVLKHLAKSFDIHIGAFVDDPSDLQHVDRLRAMSVSSTFIEGGRMNQKMRLPRAWFSDTPLSVALWQDRRMKDYVKAVLSDGSVQNVYVFSGQMAPYIQKYTSRRRTIIMDFVDVDSDKFDQYAARASWPKKAVYGREARLLKQFEKQVARIVDASLFVSEAEARLFRRHAGSYAHTVYPLENGVDLEMFRPSGAKPAPHSLVFTGAMDYLPNMEAVDWMVKDILPIVRRTHPGASFTIVGSNPAPEVKRLAGKGVTVTGTVPDVRPHVHDAAVAVAPIKTARGIQNKVLEAMAMGRPVVATEAAFSGIRAQPGRDLIVEDDTDAFAGAITALFDNPDRAEALGRAGRARMESVYSWPARLSDLDLIMAKHSHREEEAA
ncbi:MAG: TIGR03087 family PEP-CTERM/XrtA system glycosyltransferase [Pacificimonas sp.]|nr:TIGR03087 family PEP-CTERM/XrtA system glycosyltransferase [Pacificimonas sp.]